MKKFIGLFCSIALILAFSHVAMADLSALENGTIDSSVIIDAVPTKAPEKDKTSSGTSSGHSSSSFGPVATAKPVSETPAPDVSVITQTPENPFSDVSASDWFYDDVMYVYGNNIMSGVGSDAFSPKTGITRAMMITILHRVAGEPQTNGAAFSDVDSSAWYAKAVSWGAENKIVNGTGENQFSPDSDITREQLAVMLYNYRKISTDADTKADISSYADHGAVSAWAVDAMSWAVGNGIINGKSDTELSPSDGATRAEAAAIIRRYIAM